MSESSWFEMEGDKKPRKVAAPPPLPGGIAAQAPAGSSDPPGPPRPAGSPVGPGSRDGTLAQSSQTVRRAEMVDGSFADQWASSRDANDGTRLFRPEKRFGQPAIVIFDERGVPGETIVIRKREFRIGRAQGDLVVPHDLLVSGKHACLIWRETKLILADEGSRNGTYWRLRRGCTYDLRDGDRFLCGRYVFQWSHSTGIIRAASFTDSGGAVRDFDIRRSGVLTVGRHANCTVPIPDDDFLSPRHAVIRFSPEHQTFKLADMHSLNGIYIRLTGPMPLANGDMFRLGEQLIGVLFPTPKVR